MRTTIGAILLALAGGGLYAQTFEAATVKPAGPPAGGMMRIGMNGGPGTPDPGRIDYSNTSLKDVLTKAFGVKNYQISGPAWIDSERYDIVATMARGTSKADFEIMLQNLLKERFKLGFHREKKELPAYALIVAKNGPKLKESAPDAGGTEMEPPPAGPGRMGKMPEPGKDGFPDMPPRRGGQMMIMMPGRAKLAMYNHTLGDFTDMLSRQLDRPVVDMTGLTGKYDVTLYFLPEAMGKGGMPMLAGPPPGAGMAEGPMHAPDADAEPAPNLFTAVQEQLGLKLDARKAPVELIVVDRVEKVPTEN